jgi:hypothetical protein
LTWQEVRPGDTLGIPATFQVQAATGACASPEHGPTQVLVTLPLDGTGATPDDVYGRTVYAAWRGTPRPLRHVRIALDSMTMHDDLDHDSLTPGSDDCECAWFWSSVDRAPDETLRLSDKAIDLSHMNDVGDGETVLFDGAAWDFVVADGQAITLRTFGFDGGVGEGAWDPTQDCFDDHFGHHDFSEHFNIDLFDIADVCYASVAIWGSGPPNDDPFDVIERVVSAGELNTLIGDWPATGSAQLTVPSLRRCEVGLTAGPVNVSVKVVCASAAQIRDFYENAGFHVTSVSEYNQYDLHYTLTIEGTDSDGDGLSDADEPGLCTNPLDADTDHDGLSDGAEINTHHTDPLDADTDDDGLKDGDEVNTHHTDPLDPDSDDDGLNDGTEVGVGTDPLDADSDDDGIPDGRDPGFVRGVVERLDDSAFRAGGNETAMLAILDAVEKAVAAGDVKRALKELGLLRARVDGCGSAADADDWIVDCPSQERVRELLDLLMANLGR